MRVLQNSSSAVENLANAVMGQNRSDIMFEEDRVAPEDRPNGGSELESALRGCFGLPLLGVWREIRPLNIDTIEVTTAYLILGALRNKHTRAKSRERFRLLADKNGYPQPDPEWRKGVAELAKELEDEAD